MTNSPASTFQSPVCPLQYAKARSGRCTLIRRDSEGSRWTLAKPLSSRTGRSTEQETWPTYTCTTSAPALSPTLDIFSETETPVAVLSTLRLAKTNLV